MLAEDIKRRALSIPEVARLLGRTETATRRAIERGTIPSRKWGRRVVVLAAELDTFLQSLPIRRRNGARNGAERPA